ncbi:MAG: tryptophan synthase subunit alpha [Spirochaetota bacterium]
MKAKLMAHMVASYPDFNRSLEVAEGLAALGADYIELQFPFSDPTADGPLIQSACHLALQQGFTLEQGFELVRRITENLNLPLFVMSYASPVVVYGVKHYLQRVQQSGAAGVIIPDLPVGCDEGLFSYAEELGLEAVAVVAPNISQQRLQELAAMQPNYIYAALRAGITGKETQIHSSLIDFLEQLRTTTGAKIFGGFGVRNSQQAEELSPHVHAVVVGSQLVRVLNRALQHQEDIVEALRHGMDG